MSHAVTADERNGVLDRISDLFFARPKLFTLVLLLPPLLWIGIVYVGSLFALLLQSFYSLDDFSGLIVHQFTLVDLRAAARGGQSPDHHTHADDGGASHARLRGDRHSRSPITRRGMRAAGARRCSISR